MSLQIELMYAVCIWVIHELEFIGKERAARALQAYWRDKDIVVLSELLEFAQFPDPMDVRFGAGSV